MRYREERTACGVVEDDMEESGQARYGVIGDGRTPRGSES